MYPGPGYPVYPPYGYTPPPSGATAITAAVLSTLVGLLGSVGVCIGLIEALDPDNDVEPAAFIGIGVGALIAMLWLLGALLLFMRQTAGRVIVIGLSSIALIGALVLVAIGGIAGTLPLVLSGSIFGLSIASPTGRWIAARRRPSYPPAYPPPPYGQPPYPYY
ncbi:hypothetical protein APR11_001164 [Nocardia amikacinitolerans]|uniref:hypothetical protein n=1 Tax=Nocardia amikacinitolerans TaxID=756689 RepID=UPI0020A3778F|nr:hypothetical protein [Nocardia amikacinitolerans]MCP2294757.1 hypothetical protein [Nocardia amikacinitolerans]